MRRPTLRSQLNQIRLWLRQGRTEAWIAHKLDISVATLEQFKRDHQLGAEPSAPESTAAEPTERPAPSSGLAPEEDEEEEEELEREPEAVGAALDSSDVPAPPGADDDSGSEAGLSDTEAAVIETETVGIGPEPAGSDALGAVEAVETAAREPEEGEDDEEEEETPGPRRRRRRGRRGGRRRGAKQAQYEATFDHGEEVYALRLDPAVADNPVYEKHWAGHRTVEVILEPDAITIRRVETEDERVETEDDPRE